MGRQDFRLHGRSIRDLHEGDAIGPRVEKVTVSGFRIVQKIIPAG